MTGRPSIAFRRALAAGAFYAAFVFLAGVALGAFRTLMFEPLLGAFGSVALELPAMLAISWFACGWALRRFLVPAELAARLVMGLAAFALLMSAELALAFMVFSRTFSDFIAGFASPAGGLGLAGQIAFGLMPALRR